MAEFAGYSRNEPDILIHLFVVEEGDQFIAACGKRMPKRDLIDASGLGDDEPIDPKNPHLCPLCYPQLAKWAAEHLDE